MNALQFFLQHHARVHSTEVAETQGRSLEDLVLGGLSEDQIRFRPREGMNSLAWLLWHMARTEDVLVNVVIAGRPQVFDEESWAAHLKVACRGIGTGMAEDEVSELSTKVDISALRAYRAAVGRRTQAIVGGLRPEALDEVVDASRIERAISQGAFGEKGGWVADQWRGRTTGFLLGAPINHNALHLGEAMCVRSQAGLGLGL